MAVMKTIILTVSLMLKVSEGANTTCKDVTASDTGVDKTCFDNALWAQANGSQLHPEWYTNYPTVNNKSSVATWQCVLYRKSQNDDVTGGQESHNCTQPCDFNDDCTPKPTTTTTTPVAAAAADTKAVEKSGGFPVWGWVLLIMGVCCLLPLLGICCAGFMCYEAVAFILDPIMGGKKEGAQKKKRAVKKIEAEPAAAPVATLAPVYTTSVPMPVYQSAPMVTYAAPQYVVEAQPVYAAQAASVTYAAPAVTYAAPPASVSFAAPAVTYAAQPASVSYAASALPYTGDVITHHVDGHTSQHHMQ